MINEKEYIDFLTELIKRVEKHYTGKVTGEIYTNIKINNVPVTGILVKKEGEQVAPTFYLEEQFTDWMSGKSTLDEVFEQLRKTYEQELLHNSKLPSQISFEWENFKKNVYMRIVNTEKNAELLEKVPHQEFLDLSIVYYHSVPMSHGINGTLLITNEHIKLLNISAEELHEQAKKNEELFHPSQLYSMFGEIDCATEEEASVLQKLNTSSRMYILTTKSTTFGAIVMTEEKELKRFAQSISKNFYILPSSIHEIILVPETEESSAEDFASMVCDVNKTYVDPTEVLSNSVYYYDRKTEQVNKVWPE